MADRYHPDEIRGKTLRWTWTEGPTQGTAHEHMFHDDGTVSWREVENRAPARKPEPGDMGPEKADYAALNVADNVYLVSYLAKSGFTLTVVLNFNTHKLAGFASGAKEWYPVQGTFQVVD